MQLKCNLHGTFAALGWLSFGMNSLVTNSAWEICEGKTTMSHYDPDLRARSANAGGGWIIGIVVVVLVGLGVWWWATTTGPGPQTAHSDRVGPATTTGSAPASTMPATPTGAPSPPAK